MTGNGRLRAKTRYIVHAPGLAVDPCVVTTCETLDIRHDVSVGYMVQVVLFEDPLSLVWMPVSALQCRIGEVL